MSSSRREFLSSAALGLAGLTLGARRFRAIDLPPTATPNDLGPDLYDPAFLQTLATRAVDAAKSTGASYADVRVGDYQDYRVSISQGTRTNADFAIRFSYGVRSLVDGRWGFVHGTVPTADAIATAARQSVAQARNAAIQVSPIAEFVPPPASTGEWRSPLEIDPFAVPLHEQWALQRWWNDVSQRVWGVSGGGNAAFGWQRETRVFASSEGSLLTQHLHQSQLSFSLLGDRMLGAGITLLTPPAMFMQRGGYELVAGESILDQIEATAEEVRRLSSLPARTIEVGRYPVVFDGTTFGAMLYKTIGRALELDRVLGEEAGASGTSVLAPVDAMLGTQIVSPLLTVTADRTAPSAVSVRWDDDGVEPTAGPVISDGRLVDYQTSQRTAPRLTRWYQQHDRPAASRGCAVAPSPENPVLVRCGHLTATPSAQTVTLDDLIRDMPRGIVVRQLPGGNSDQQLSTGLLSSGYGIFEVERGRLVRRVMRAGLQWRTLPFLKGLAALGDRTTVMQVTGFIYKGQPWHPAVFHSTAPAALFREVDVIEVGRPLA